MLISFLIPTYNRPEKTIRAIMSALNQTYRNIEIIVTDNSENEDTHLLIKSLINDPRLFYYHNNKNIGLLNNWKKAFSYANGELIKILFSDDWVEQHYCEQTVKYFIENENVNLAFSGVIYKGEEHDELLYKLNSITHFNLGSYFKQLVLHHNLSLSPGNCVFRKKAISFRNFYFNAEINKSINETGAGADILLILSSLQPINSIGIGLPFISSFFEGKDDSITLNRWNQISTIYNQVLYFFLEEIEISDKEVLLRKLNDRIMLKNIKYPILYKVFNKIESISRKIKFIFSH